jgi:hypothetical protein
VAAAATAGSTRRISRDGTKVLNALMASPRHSDIRWRDYAHRHVPTHVAVPETPAILGSACGLL